MSTDVLFDAPPLDHVFVVVSAETLTAVNGCRLLAGEAFGRFATREAESTLVGRYRPTRIVGDNTLIELFPDRFGEGEFAGVTCGLVFSFVRIGDREAARRRLADAAIPFQAELLSRPRGADGRLGPFYHSTRPAVGGPLALFLSEVTSDYMDYLGAPLDPHGRFDRGAYHTASLGRPPPPDALLRDIIGVTLRLAPGRAARLAKVMTLVGYEAAEGAGEITLSGPNLDVRVLTCEDDGPEGLREVRMRLAEAPARQRFDFGPTSALQLAPDGAGDARAVWRFNLGFGAR